MSTFASWGHPAEPRTVWVRVSLSLRCIWGAGSQHSAGIRAFNRQYETGDGTTDCTADETGVRTGTITHPISQVGTSVRRIPCGTVVGDKQASFLGGTGTLQPQGVGLSCRAEPTSGDLCAGRASQGLTHALSLPRPQVKVAAAVGPQA